MLKNPRVWLLVVLFWVCFFEHFVAQSVIDDLRYGETKPASPVQFDARLNIVSSETEDAQDAGIREGDTLELVDGHPFTSMSVLEQAVLRRQPGYLLPLTVRSERGTGFSVEVRIPPAVAGPATDLEWISQVLFSIGLPVFCLSIGFWVAFLRPKNRIAWLFLALMIGFAGMGQSFPFWDAPSSLLFPVWWIVFASKFGLWPVWLLLIAILFPAPPELERKVPWFKWLLSLPLLLNTAALSFWIIGRQFSFAAIERLRTPLRLALALRTDLMLPAFAVLFFFIAIGLKSATIPSADARRRLRLLFIGSFLSLSAVLIQLARAMIQRSDFLNDAAPLQYVVTLLPLLLFPITLAYVILVRRALEVRITLRHAIQYALAQRGLTVLQMIVTAMVIAVITVLPAARNIGFTVRMESLAIGLGVIVLLRPVAQRLAPWVDRLLFRESYNDERLMRQLVLSLHSLMEENALIQMLTDGISQALHVQRAALLLNSNGDFTALYAVGYKDQPALSLAEGGGVVRHLKISQRAAAIYCDDEKNWIQTIHPDERESLRKSQTEVVLPLASKDKLLGVMALGPRRSEAPYTKHDLQWLDAAAVQAGVALANSRLAAQWAEDSVARQSTALL